MIKTILLHKIFEISIDTLFNGFITNLNSGTPNGYRVGQRFNELVFDYETELINWSIYYRDGMVVGVNNNSISINFTYMKKQPRFKSDNRLGNMTTHFGHTRMMTDCIATEFITSFK